MNNCPKVSVIIPVYNAGHRLKACIESLVHQTLKELELIFVLDCPTDGSDKMVFEYANQYENITVLVNDRNLNIGLSRNKGLHVANGEYVAFCDHDDVVKPDMYEQMFKVGCMENADIVLGVPEYSYEDTSLNRIYYYPQEGDIKNTLLPLIIGKDLSMKGWEFYFSHGVIWDNIYRRKMIKDHQIQFVDNNLITYEDNLFLIDCLANCNKAIVYNKLVYNHTIEDSNTASTGAYNDTNKVMSYISYLNNLLSKNGIKEKYIGNFKNSVLSYVKDCYRSEFSNRDVGNLKKQLDIIKSNPDVKTLFANICMSDYVKDSRSFAGKFIQGIIFQYLKK